MPCYLSTPITFLTIIAHVWKEGDCSGQLGQLVSQFFSLDRNKIEFLAIQVNVKSRQVYMRGVTVISIH